MADELIHAMQGPIGTRHPIEQVALVPGGKGIFEVRRDGTVIFSKKVEGRHPKPGEILAMVQ